LSENPNTLCRIRRDRARSAAAFVVMTAVTITVAVLRDNWALPSGVWGVTLILWVLTGVAWIVTRYVTPVVEAQTRQAKQIKRLTEATKVSGWSAAMDEDTNVRRINRR
jgi:hypothetical protein